MTFSTIGLSQALLAAVCAQGYRTPTPIQRAAIAPALDGRDVIGRAQTGSGKTLAFVLPLLQRLTVPSVGCGTPQALVLAPTRELAEQVGTTVRAIAGHLPQRIKISVVFGGVSINPQMMQLRGGTNVIIATPGRLLDLMSRNAVSLGSVKLLVLDEADRLLDLGFSNEVQEILAQLPAERQSLFFSATFNASVQTLADQILNNPVWAKVENYDVYPAKITQRAFEVDTGQRARLLRHLIAEYGWTRVLVFVATKYSAEMVADKMRRAGLKAEPFHGALGQGKRTQVLMDFKASRLDLVVATDLAARGLDIAELPVVVNFDLPRSPRDYIHRIGRTGRSDFPGLAISFVNKQSISLFGLIKKRLQFELPLEQVLGFESQQSSEAAPTSNSPDNGGVKGRRMSKKDKVRAALDKSMQSAILPSKSVVSGRPALN